MNDDFDIQKREVLEKRAKAAGYTIKFTQSLAEEITESSTGKPEVPEISALVAIDVPERFNYELPAPEIPTLQGSENAKAPEIILPPKKPKRKAKLKSMRRRKQK